MGFELALSCRKRRSTQRHNTRTPHMRLLSLLATLVSAAAGAGDAVQLTVHVDRTAHVITSVDGSERAITSACREWCDTPVGRSILGVTHHRLVNKGTQQLGESECVTLIAERFRLEREARRPTKGDLEARPWLPADDARTVLMDMEGESPAGAAVSSTPAASFSAAEPAARPLLREPELLRSQDFSLSDATLYKESDASDERSRDGIVETASKISGKRSGDADADDDRDRDHVDHGRNHGSTPQPPQPPQPPPPPPPSALFNIQLQCQFAGPCGGSLSGTVDPHLKRHVADALLRFADTLLQEAASGDPGTIPEASSTNVPTAITNPDDYTSSAASFSSTASSAAPSAAASSTASTAFAASTDSTRPTVSRLMSVLPVGTTQVLLNIGSSSNPLLPSPAHPHVATLAFEPILEVAHAMADKYRGTNVAMVAAAVGTESMAGLQVLTLYNAGGESSSLRTATAEAAWNNDVCSLARGVVMRNLNTSDVTSDVNETLPH